MVVMSKMEDQSQGRNEHGADQHKMDKATASAIEKQGGRVARVMRAQSR